MMDGMLHARIYGEPRAIARLGIAPAAKKSVVPTGGTWNSEGPAPLERGDS